MRWRYWIRFIAVFSVLLHVGALVRHNGAALANSFGDSLAASLLVICHGSADAGFGSLQGSGLTPVPLDTRSSCPICSGQVSAFALAAPAPPEITATIATIFERQFRQRLLTVQRSAVCPPARGPPTVV